MTGGRSGIGLACPALMTYGEEATRARKYGFGMNHSTSCDFPPFCCLCVAVLLLLLCAVARGCFFFFLLGFVASEKEETSRDIPFFLCVFFLFFLFLPAPPSIFPFSLSVCLSPLPYHTLSFSRVLSFFSSVPVKQFDMPFFRFFFSLLGRYHNYVGCLDVDQRC